MEIETMKDVLADQVRLDGLATPEMVASLMRQLEEAREEKAPLMQQLEAFREQVAHLRGEISALNQMIQTAANAASFVDAEAWQGNRPALQHDFIDALYRPWVPVA